MSETGTGERLRTALANFLPDGDRITAIRPLTTGFSNDTYMVDGLDLVLRLPPSAGAMLDGHDVLAQARIYQALGESPGAPPVPAIVAQSDDPAIMGAPFFVMQRIEGEAVSDVNPQPWFADAADTYRNALCHQWICAFADLAKLAPLPVLGEPVTPEDDARRWMAFAEKANAADLVQCFLRLLDVPAPLSGPVAVVHGDPKLSNVMWQEGRISALLDWEMALNGEPLADLGYMLYGPESPYHTATRQQKLTGMLDRATLISIWEDRSGRSAQGVFWHEIAQIGKIAAIIAEGCDMYVSGRSTDPKLAYFRDNLTYYQNVMRNMLDSVEFQSLKG